MRFRFCRAGFFLGGIFFLQSLVADVAGVDLFQQKQYEKSLQVFKQQLKQAPTNHRARFYLGRSLFEMGRYREAATALLQARDQDPQQSPYHYWLARAYGESARYSNFMRQAFLAPKIRKGFEAAVQLDPGSIQARIGLANFYMQAPKMMGGSKTLALQQAAAIKKLDPVEGDLMYAQIFERQKKADAATAIYKNLVKHHGAEKKYAHIYDHYGEMLLNQKRYPESLSMYRKQILLVPKSDKAYVSMARAQEKMRQYRKALEFYRRAQSINRYNRAARSRIRALTIQLSED